MARPYAFFGPGTVNLVPLIDADGATVTNPTPVRILEVQNFDIGLKFDEKQLYGQNQFPIEVAHGKGSFPLSFSAGRVYSALIQTAVFGQSTTTSLEGKAEEVSGSIPSTPGPYTVTPTVPNSGTWSVDLGVRGTDGLPYTRVASAPATGQYSVSAGVYTFAAADQGLTVYFDFWYTKNSGGKLITLNSKNMGSTPEVALYLNTTYKGQAVTMRFPRCTASSEFSLGLKLDDFGLPKYTFQVQMADEVTKVLGYVSLPA